MDETSETSHETGSADWRHTVENLTSSTEHFVHEDPTKAIGLALFAGVLLTVLPVGRLFAALVRLAFALVRPLLLILGAMRIYEELQKKPRS